MYRLAIDQIPAETRIAILNGDDLVSLHIERKGLSQHAPVQAGNIYWGRVVNVVPSLQAAFVDFGGEQNGFLPAKSLGCDDIAKAVQHGQYVCVQVKKEPSEDKGALLSAKIELNAPDCILTPLHPGINVSRKFTDTEQRHRMQQALQEELTPDCGLIVRTSAQTLTAKQVLGQAKQLQHAWLDMLQLRAKHPVLLYAPTDFIEQVWQRYTSVSFEEVIVEGMEAFHTLKKLNANAQLHSDSQALFERLGIEEQIEQALATEVPLADGGSIVIERTKALIAIDVNMGTRTDHYDDEGNRLQLNLIALEAINQQMELRNLSGQIYIDFVRLKSIKARNRLLEACKTVFTQDKRCHLHGFTRLGLLELSRARKDYGLDELYNDPLSTALALVRQLAYVRGRKRILMGTRLFRLWSGPALKDSLDWLEERLGYRVDAVQDDYLPPLSYKLEE
ncbi:MAG: ribonuclease E/G [Terasakiella sp.]|uniref:ribonuclease E/G n=1 Tax=unclassified Terasakiella TaxID=2614952 RepID=UPI003B002F00